MQVKEGHTPPCDGCKCRDDEIKLLRAVVDLVKRGSPMARPPDLQKAIEALEPSPTIKPCSTCRHIVGNEDRDTLCGKACSNGKYQFWEPLPK